MNVTVDADTARKIMDGTVRFLAVPEPLKCERCEGDGEVDVEDTEFDQVPLDQMECIICPDCDGTGRPATVNIWSGADHENGTWSRAGHGPVTLGEPVPVYGSDPGMYPDMLATDVPCSVVLDEHNVVLWDGSGEFTDITDAISEQPEPGWTAYPVTPKVQS